jgi:predicted phage tail protein
MTALALPVVREVWLYGVLGRQFGRVFRLAVKTPAEAVQALCAVLPGFRRAFTGSDGRAAYHVFVGRGALRRDISAEQTAEPLGAAEPIRFVPVVAGAKRQGAFQTILGVVLLVAAAFGYGNNQTVALGLQLVLGGVIQLLSPQRKKDEKDNRALSYAFDGPVNNTEQGGPVPLVFGRVICGSTVVSQGLSTEEVIIPAVDAIDPQTLPGYEPGFPTDGG